MNKYPLDIKSTSIDDSRRVIETKNGITCILYPRKNCMSVTMGVFVRAGAWNERPNEAGVAHVIEHMMFKSTEKHSTAWINDQFSALGASVNAYTDWDVTCYHATVPSLNWKEMFYILTEMIRQPKFSDAELNTERSAILAEINRRNDQHETMTLEDAHGHLFAKDKRYGGAIIGDAEIVKRLKSADLKKFYKRNYTAKNICIVMVGKIDEDAVISYVDKKWNDLPSGRLTERLVESVGTGESDLERNSEQAHFVQAVNLQTEAMRPESHAANVLTTIYGGGMSSRLYREIREKRGLAYQCGCYSSLYGRFTNEILTYVATFPKSVDKVRSLVEKIQMNLTNKKVTDEELTNAKLNIIGSMQVEHDIMPVFMRTVGSAWANLATVGDVSKYYDTYEQIRGIKAVTANDVLEVAQKIFIDSDTWTAIGMKKQ